MWSQDSRFIAASPVYSTEFLIGENLKGEHPITYVYIGSDINRCIDI